MLRIEWAKARARRDRWIEDVTRVRHQMDHSVRYCRWKALWWRTQVARRPDLTPALAEGLKAYALEHAAHEDDLAARWLTAWEPIMNAADQLLAEPLDTTPQPSATTQPSNGSTRATAFVHIVFNEEGDDEDDFEGEVIV